MSIEGGAFRCFIHTDKAGNPFETSNIEEWNAHCSTAVEPPHEEEADWQCEQCGDVYHAKLPFHKLGADGSKGIRFTCNDCGEKQKGVEMTKVQTEQTKRKEKK
jgi:rubredoxin